MAADNEELVIDIPTGEIPVSGTEPIAVKRDAPAPRVSAAKADTDRLARLERDRDNLQQERDLERAARARAEAEAAHAREGHAQAFHLAVTRENQAMHAHWAKINADLENIKSASSSTQIEAETAQQAYIAASEAGDFTKAADAQRRIARAESALSQLETGRIAAERHIEDTRSAFQRVAEERQRPEPRREPAPAQQEKPIAPDAWIDGARMTIGDDGADWLRENKEFVTDADKNAKFIAYANYYAKKHGQAALKSEAFRDTLDAEFEVGEVEDTPRREAKETGGRVETVRPRATSSAPVSRSGNVFSSRNLNAGAMRAPPDIVRFCKEAGLDVAKYMLAAREEVIKGDKPKEWLDPDYDRGMN